MKQRWRESLIGDLCRTVDRWEEPVPGVEYRQIGVRLWGNGAYEREPLDGADTKYAKLNCVRTGDIIVNKIWARNGSVSVVDGKLDGCYCSGEFPLFEPLPEKLESRWFYLITKTRRFWDCCDVQSRGTSGKNRIRPERFLEIPIPLPPLPEQRRIVAKVEELATKIAESQSIRQRLVVETDSVPSSVADSVFDSVQCTWRTIDELVGRGNLRNGKSIKPMDILTGVQCIRLSALENGRINCRDAKPVAMTEEEAKPYLMKPGDVFVMRGNGSKHLVGRAGLVEGTIPGTIFPDLFIRIPLEGTGVSSHFFVRFWNSRQMRTVIENTCKTTSGIWKINQGHIASFSIPVPLPSEQRRIVAHLDDLQAKVNALKTQQAESAAELDAMLPSILDKAFKGKL